MRPIKHLIDLTERLAANVTDRRTVDALREIQLRLGQLQVEHAAELERRMALMHENERLRRQISALKSKEAAVDKVYFVEHEGALFKRRVGGGFHTTVYCPRCKNACAASDGTHYTCPTCRWTAAFSKKDIAGLLKELWARETQNFGFPPNPANPE